MNSDLQEKNGRESFQKEGIFDKKQTLLRKGSSLKSCDGDHQFFEIDQE
jgi:hypothetical protein